MVASRTILTVAPISRRSVCANFSFTAFSEVRYLQATPSNNKNTPPGIRACPYNTSYSPTLCNAWRA